MNESEADKKLKEAIMSLEDLIKYYKASNDRGYIYFPLKRLMDKLE